MRSGRPAAEWELSFEGRERARALALQLAPYDPDLIGSSTERKAQQTAAIVSEALGKPFQIFEGIHEQERRSLELAPSQEDFEQQVAEFFGKPDDLAFGDETARQALARFRNAVDAIVEAHPDEDLALVSHGRVIALYVADYTGLEPYAFWKRLGLPSFVVLSLPGREVIKVVQA